MQPLAFNLPGLLHGGKREGVSELCTSRESSSLTVRIRRRFNGLRGTETLET